MACARGATLGRAACVHSPVGSLESVACAHTRSARYNTLHVHCTWRIRAGQSGGALQRAAEPSVSTGSAGSAEVRAKLAEGAGSAADKLRLATLYLLVAERPPAAADTQALAEALREAGADEAAFNYVVRMKQMNLTGGGAGGAAAPAAGGSKGWAMPGIDASLVSGIAGQFSKQLTKLVGGTRQVRSPLTRLPGVESWNNSAWCRVRLAACTGRASTR